MSLMDVRTALAQAFVDGSFFANEDIAWENLAFTPGKGGKWAKFTFVPAQPSVATLGQGGTDEHKGFVQIDLNYPLGSGDDDAMAKYNDIYAVFKAGSRFIAEDQVVIITTCGRTPGRDFGGYYRVSVTIYFYAQIQR